MDFIPGDTHFVEQAVYAFRKLKAAEEAVDSARVELAKKLSLVSKGAYPLYFEKTEAWRKGRA